LNHDNLREVADNKQRQDNYLKKTYRLDLKQETRQYELNRFETTKTTHKVEDEPQDKISENRYRNTRQAEGDQQQDKI
jgi:hypothetical protein